MMMTNERGISLMSITAKVYNRILLNQTQSEIEPHLRNEQNEFRPKRFTIQQILVLRRLIEGTKCKNLPCQLSCIDFRKVFDSINLDQMFKTLRAYGIPAKMVNAVYALYSNTTATVRTAEGLMEEFRLHKSVLQGDVLAPYLFTIILDYAMRLSTQPEDGFTLQRRTGSIRPAQKISDLAFADDIVTLADSKTAAEEVLNRISTSTREVGLTVNKQKTKFIALNKDAVNAIHLDNEEIGLAEDYKYLDAWIMPFANDINVKALAFQAITRLNRVWKANLTRKTKIRLFQSTVTPILMYGSETWTLTKEDGAYTRLLTRALNVDYQQHMTNKALYQDLPSCLLEKIKDLLSLFLIGLL